MLGESAVLFGAHYRWKDAIIPSAAIHIGAYYFQISYDLEHLTITKVK